MRVAVGSNHAGFELKEDLKVFLHELGHEIVDVGTGGRHPDALLPHVFGHLRLGND